MSVEMPIEMLKVMLEDERRLNVISEEVIKDQRDQLEDLKTRFVGVTGQLSETLRALGIAEAKISSALEVLK